MKDFYVYAYCYPTEIINDELLTHKPFYIGKGQDKRIDNHLYRVSHDRNTHNKYLTNIIKKLLNAKQEPIRIKLYDNLDCIDAYVLEFETIAKYGRTQIDKDGILVNRSAGLEHFNLRFSEPIRQQLLQLDFSKHFNFKDCDQELIDEICRLYEIEEYSFNMLYAKFKMGKKKMRQILTDNNIHIRTKSETRMGDKNPAFGKPGSFKGKKHKSKTIKKMSEARKSYYKKKASTSV